MTYSYPFLFVGDLHLCDRGISTRRDVYASTCLDKLRQIRDIVVANKETRTVIFSGDIFHLPSGHSLSWLWQMKDILSSFPVPCYTIIGNHDTVKKDLSAFYRTSLGHLVRDGYFRLLSTSGCVPVNDNDDVIAGLSAYEDLPSIQDDRVVGLVVHHFMPPSRFKEEDLTITVPQLKAVYPRLRFVLAGHEHSPHPPIVVDDVCVLRPGSIMRTASDDVGRDIGVYQCALSTIFEFTYDFIPLSAAADADIFRVEKRASKWYIRDTVQNLSNALATTGAAVTLQDLLAAELAALPNERIRSFIKDDLYKHGFGGFDGGI